MRESVKRLKGYSLINREDGLAYDFVVAYNVKEAKKLMIENCSDWMCDYLNPFIEFYAKWDKGADISGLLWGHHVEGIDLLKRDIVSSLDYCECPICKKEDVTIYKDDTLIEGIEIACAECFYGDSE